MSHEEKEETINKLALDVSGIKRWYPIVAGMITTLGIIITLTVKVTSAYNNDIAKKQDLQPIIENQKLLSEQMKDLNADFKVYKENDVAYKANDKAERAEDRKTLFNHIIAANKQFAKLNNMLSFYTQHYTVDKNGNRVITNRPAKTSIN